MLYLAYLLSALLTLLSKKDLDSMEILQRKSVRMITGIQDKIEIT